MSSGPPIKKLKQSYLSFSFAPSPSPAPVQEIQQPLPSIPPSPHSPPEDLSAAPALSISNTQLGSTGSSEQPDYDIGQFVDHCCPDNLKQYIISTCWTAPPGFLWPHSVKQYGQKVSNRYLSQMHINSHPNFAYSTSKEGVFCKLCVLARPSESTKRALGKLVTEPLRRYDRLAGPTGDLNKHSSLEYHKFAATQCKLFSTDFHNNTNIRSKIDTHHQQVCQSNRARLRPVIKTIIFCGQNNIALQGNHDSGPFLLDQNTQGEGNFRRLLKFRVDAGDTELKHHLTTGAKNAMYTSPEIQNDVISCIGEQILDSVLERIKGARYYTILADETTDISTVEQMSLCFRYFDEKLNDVREDFVCFEDIIDKQYADHYDLDDSEATSIPKTLEEYLEQQEELNQQADRLVEPRMSGAVIAKAIINKLEDFGLNLNGAVAQGYDGAAVMSSENVGTSANVKISCPHADYYHCSPHSLNLVLTHASKIPQIRNMIASVNEIQNFLSSSNKRILTLRRAVQFAPRLSEDSKQLSLEHLCETRWVARVTALEKFVTYYIPITRAMMTITRWKDSTASSKAQSLLSAITNSQFIVALYTTVAVLQNTDILSKQLQSKTVDICAAMESINDIVDVLDDTRSNAIQSFKTIYSWMLDSIMPLKIEITAPRQCQRQTQRSNPLTPSPENYYRQTIFLPFLDTVLAQMKLRFTEKTKSVKLLDVLTTRGCQCDDAEEKFVNLFGIHKAALLDNNTLLDPGTIDMKAVFEFKQWRKNCEGTEQKTLLETLRMCNFAVFPVVHDLLIIAVLVPVSTATPERTFSALRLMKTFLRNRTKEERLNGLALMYFNGDFPINIENVIDRFADLKQRRLILK